MIQVSSSIVNLRTNPWKLKSFQLVRDESRRIFLRTNRHQLKSHLLSLLHQLTCRPSMSKNRLQQGKMEKAGSFANPSETCDVHEWSQYVCEWMHHSNFKDSDSSTRRQKYSLFLTCRDESAFLKWKFRAFKTRIEDFALGIYTRTLNIIFGLFSQVSVNASPFIS